MDASRHTQETERRGEDRRQGQRRDPRWRFDPLFLATIVNQITPPTAAPFVRDYGPGRPTPKRGRVLNIRA